MCRTFMYTLLYLTLQVIYKFIHVLAIVLSIDLLSLLFRQEEAARANALQQGAEQHSLDLDVRQSRRRQYYKSAFFLVKNMFKSISSLCLDLKRFAISI